MGNHCRIRPAVSTDGPGMVAVERAAFRTPWEEAAFEVSDGLMWLVAENDGGIIGFALGRSVLDEGEVLNIAVLPDSRGSGVGSELLSELLQQMRRSAVEKVYLDVRGSNESAISLYRKIGFEIVGSRTGYYSNPTENALQMMVFLSA
jgi:ribosomal-protein-alanine N-acetyltransferase